MTPTSPIPAVVKPGLQATGRRQALLAGRSCRGVYTCDAVHRGSRGSPDKLCVELYRPRIVIDADPLVHPMDPT